MLFLYQRIVNGLWVAKFIKPAMGLVVATFIAIMMILFCSCRPYHRMWIVYPDQGEICQPQATINLVPALVMNILTDMCIMAIPAPVILPVKTTIWRKVSLLVLFGAGFFIMTAAVLRVVFVLVVSNLPPYSHLPHSLPLHPSSPAPFQQHAQAKKPPQLGNGKTAAIWSCREDLVAILVGQAPMLRPLFTRKFWAEGYGPNSTHFSSSPGGGRHKSTGMSYELSANNNKRSYKKKDPYSTTAVLATMQDSDSTEKIIDGGASSYHHGSELTPGEMESGELGGGRLVISVKSQVDVESVECGSSVGGMERIEEERVEYLRPGDASAWNRQHGLGAGGNGYAGRA
ncbi:hypothetical protein MPH_05934 [Macrophomina phaseolina MS6]|uniref:Rhodopsin domain-containing protein n=1 Tax=Macrophomina phaseolina (strain MS6) TaxID=1126212 RepID=K2R3D3_MACPH|nr:hypothetical protein MPH_05934 [Macrophomina phaseolina MS6]